MSSLSHAVAAPQPRARPRRYDETYPRRAAGTVSSVMGTPSATPGVDVMGGPDRSPGADVMGGVDGDLRFHVVGGAEGG
jgi:hypothetical protein